MRKRPQQQRAKMIVESILEGTQKCISEYGVLQLTTQKFQKNQVLVWVLFTSISKIKSKLLLNYY